MHSFTFEYELPDEKDIWHEAVIHDNNLETALARLRYIYPKAVIRYRKVITTYYKPAVHEDV